MSTTWDMNYREPLQKKLTSFFTKKLFPRKIWCWRRINCLNIWKHVPYLSSSLASFNLSKFIHTNYLIKPTKQMCVARRGKNKVASDTTPWGSLLYSVQFAKSPSRTLKWQTCTKSLWFAYLSLPYCSSTKSCLL